MSSHFANSPPAVFARVCVGLRVFANAPMSMRLLALTDTATLRGIEDSHGHTYWSVHDFITFVCGKEAHGSEFQKRRNNYACVIFSRLVSEESEYREDLLQMSRQFKLSREGKKSHTMNIEGLLRLLVILGTKVIAEYRDIAIVQFSRYTGGDISRVNETCMSSAPMLLEFTSTANLRVMMGMNGHQYYSVFDFINIVCDKDPKDNYSKVTFKRLKEHTHAQEFHTRVVHFKFPGRGQRLTPCMKIESLQRLLVALGNKVNVKYRSMVEEAFSDLHMSSF